MPPRSNASTRGFSLVELMVTIAIAGILLALALPAMQRSLTSRAVASNAEELVSSLRFARSEALKRGSAVALCPVDTNSPPQGCGADWSKGWMVFADRDTNGSYDNGTNDLLLRVQQPPSSNQVGGPTAAGANPSYVEFVSTGMAITGGLTFTIKPTLKPADKWMTTYTRLVCVNAQGRANIVAGTATCN